MKHGRRYDPSQLSVEEREAGQARWEALSSEPRSLANDGWLDGAELAPQDSLRRKELGRPRNLHDRPIAR